MSIDYCKDCEQVVEGKTVIVYLTDDPNAYRDGEYELLCPYCGGNFIISQPEDNPIYDR
jgi:hypothetical protein